MKIHIKNFQAIQEADLEIEKLTVVVGPSDKGKSSVIRAIKSAYLNNSGNWFVKDGEKSSSVHIVDKDYDLLWEKGKGVNKQVINGEEYSKIGSTTPEDILNITKFRELDISDVISITPQIQGQHEYAFLLNKTDSQISAAISYLANTDRILAANKLCSADLKDTKSKLKTKKDEITSLENTLLKIDIDYSNTKSLFEALEIAEKEIITDNSLVESLGGFIVTVSNFKAAKDSLETLSEPGQPDIESIFTIISNIESFIKLAHVETLSLPQTPKDISKEFLESFSILETSEAYLKALYVSTVVLPEILTIEDVGGIVDSLRDIEGYLVVANDVVTITNSLNRAVTDLEQGTINITKLEKELGVCPTCSQEFGNHTH